MKKIIIISCFAIICLFANNLHSAEFDFGRGLGFSLSFNPYIGSPLSGSSNANAGDMSWGLAINYEFRGNVGRIFAEYGGAFGSRKVQKEAAYIGSYSVNESLYSHMFKLGYDYVWRTQTTGTTAFFFGLGIGGGLDFSIKAIGGGVFNGGHIGFLLRAPIQLGFNFDNDFLLYLEFTPSLVFGTTSYVALPIAIGVAFPLYN